MIGIPIAPSQASRMKRKNLRTGKNSKTGTNESKPAYASSGRLVFADVVRFLLATVVSGSFYGFPTTRVAAEQLEVPGPVVEQPAYTEFRLVPIDSTRYARFARKFFGREGKDYLFDLFGRSFGDRYVVLAGRHRITGGAVPDLVLMVVPLERIRYDPPEVNVAIFKRIENAWRLEAGTWGYGRQGYGVIRALVSPVVGVTYRYDGPDDIDPPFWVPPMRDGRRTIIWNDGGMFWDGAEWKSFCWRRCDERG